MLELLRCPSHPEAMLRVKGAHISDVFPYSGELQTPVCRSGCGFLGNWFADIPESLPRPHGMDCRRCLGIEIEKATLACPECDWSREVDDGVLKARVKSNGNSDSETTSPPGKTCAAIEKHLITQPSDLILDFTPMPDYITSKWCSNRIERLQVELNSEILLSGRAKSCATGQGMTHYLEGPLDISILRPGIFDSLIMPVPSDRIADFNENLPMVPGLLRPSGLAILIFPRERSHPRSADARLHKNLEKLPDEFRELRIRLIAAPGNDLLLVEYPEPENGNGMTTP